MHKSIQVQDHVTEDTMSCFCFAMPELLPGFYMAPSITELVWTGGAGDGNGVLGQAILKRPQVMLTMLALQ